MAPRSVIAQTKSSTKPQRHLPQSLQPHQSLRMRAQQVVAQQRRGTSLLRQTETAPHPCPSPA